MIEFIHKSRLATGADPEDLEWTRMLTDYESEEAANDNRFWHELEDSAYEYRVREVAA